MRKRWGYGYGKRPKSAEKEAGEISTRFFFKGGTRAGFYRNTISKCWWVGHNTYDSSNTINHFESLDIIGSNDLNSKITEFFYSYTFSSNSDVLQALIKALKRFKEEGRQILVRDHIRPAMAYINAVGGSVIIDCLPHEDITDIFYDAIEAIMQGDTPSLILDKASSIEEDNDDEVIKSEDEKVEVILGSTIFIRNEEGITKNYRYDFINGKMPDTLKVFTGHKVGDIIEMLDGKWKIEDIVLR